MGLLQLQSAGAAYAGVHMRVRIKAGQMLASCGNIRIKNVLSSLLGCAGLGAAWGQGFIYSDGVELATGSISCAATMALLFGYVVLVMDYGPAVLEEWRTRASCQTSRRAFKTWRGSAPNLPIPMEEQPS